MVSGFDLLGHNRTFQVHWLKRVVAFFLDLITVFAPLWSFLYLEGFRAPWVYGVAGGIVLYAYSTFSEAISRTTVGKFIVGLEVRSLRGPMSLSKAAVRNFPKLLDRKSTRLNSSHLVISYAVFCLKKKKKIYQKLSHHRANDRP